MLERVLVRGRRSWFPAIGSTRNRLVLAYHNVIPTGQLPCGDRSLHLPQVEFACQLDLLGEHAEVVPLADLLDEREQPDTLRVAITFDDAYSGAVSAGISELRTRNLPVTLFVSTARLGGHSFWWDVLASSDGLAEPTRRGAFEVCAAKDESVRDWAASEGLPSATVPRFARSAFVEELDAAMEYSGLWLGSHTQSHPDLTRIPDSELGVELSQPLDWLRARFGNRIGPWIAYPYGHSDARVESAAAAAGYLAGFRVSGGYFPSQGAKQYALPRLNIPAGLSADGFRLRLAGLFCG